MSKKILIIDDDENIRLLLKDILEGILKTGPVKEAETGMKGVELAISEKPDVIFCDINMPDISGLEVVRQLRNNPPFKNTLIIAMSAEYHYEDGILKAGANVFLKKPFDLAAIKNLF